MGFKRLPALVVFIGLFLCVYHTYAQEPGKEKSMSPPSPVPPVIVEDTSKTIPNQNKVAGKHTGHFNIALLLPFNVMQSMQFDTSGEVHYDYTPETSLAIQYYHGLLLALDSLKKTGFKLHIYVLDGGTDTNTLRKIFRSGIIDSMDLIIGPVYNSSLRVAARLAKEKNKTLISPFSSSEKITKQNPFYISATPTLRRYCYEMLTYLNSNYSSKKIFLFYNKNTDDTITVHVLKDVATGFKNLQLIPFTDRSDTTVYSKFFSVMDTNLVIVPSMDEDFTGIITTQLYSNCPTYPMVVFGMPTWGDFETLRLDYLTTIHCMVTAANWCDKTTKAYKNFEQSFINTYHARPLERNIMGYDQMMMAARLITTDSTNLENSALKVSYHGLDEDFNFIPYYSDFIETDTPDFLENANVHVLQFKKDSLIKRF